MGYPAPPNFASGTEYAAWWQFARADGVPTVCATTGARVVTQARVALGMGPGIWDDAFQQALLTQARGYQSQDTSWTSLVNALQSDGQARRVRKASLLFAIWLGWYRPVGLRLDALAVSDNFVAPAWGRALSAPTASMVCWDPGSQPSPELLNETDRANAERESTQGIRSSTALGPVNPPAGPRGASSAALWIVVGGLLLVTAYAFHQTRRGRPV